MVAGSAEILDQLDRISLVRLTCQGIWHPDTVYDDQFGPIPDQCQRHTEAKVTVTVEGLVTKTLEAGNIEIINKPGGYEITRNTQSCTVLIRGTQEAVDAVTASQVRIVADLSNWICPLEAGQCRSRSIWMAAARWAWSVSTTFPFRSQDRRNQVKVWFKQQR